MGSAWRGGGGKPRTFSDPRALFVRGEEKEQDFQLHRTERLGTGEQSKAKTFPDLDLLMYTDGRKRGGWGDGAPRVPETLQRCQGALATPTLGAAPPAEPHPETHSDVCKIQSKNLFCYGGNQRLVRNGDDEVLQVTSPFC